MAPKNLLLFTNGFPCVKEGEEFLETELHLLAKEFETIVIYILHEAEICRKIPANVKVKVLKQLPGDKVSTVILKYSLMMAAIFWNDMKDVQGKKAISKNKSFYRNVLIGNFLLMRSLHEELKQYKSAETKLYSYWCGPWFDILMLLDKNSTSKITFRAHGYDFDVNQRLEKFIPYRNYLIKKNPFIAFVSQFGYNTYSYKYPKYTNKKMYHLGVERQTKIKESRNKEEILIVSCSSLIPLKRVHLIVDILKSVTQPIKWVHFGDGALLNSMAEKAKELPSNVITEFKGYVSHDQVLEFYRENYVDLFINVSELEGIPVSLMEAISFGIPVTGCNICGVPEIVTKETGFLWEEDFEPGKAAKQLEDYFIWPADKKQQLRTSTLKFWNENFNTEKNYKAFIKECLLN